MTIIDGDNLKEAYKNAANIDDPDPTVRAIVAGQGYDLDHLINDPDENVRAAAEKQLSKKISMQHSEQKASRPKSKGRSR